MIMNVQCVTVSTKTAFKNFFRDNFDITDIQLHIGNVYLFTIPLSGELTSLTWQQKKFIFEKEVSLYETQYELTIPYDESQFEQFFEITWQGVAYHGEIRAL